MSEPETHEHVWEYSHTDADWWDGDADDIYVCTIEGCSAIDRRYIPR